MERGTKLFLINNCHLKILSIPWTTSIIVCISLKLTFFILSGSHQYADPIMHSKQLISAWGTDQNWLAELPQRAQGRTTHVLQVRDRQNKWRQHLNQRQTQHHSLKTELALNCVQRHLNGSLLITLMKINETKPFI